MNGRFLSFGSGNPLAQALSLLVFAMVLIGAVIMGAVVLAALVGLALVAFAVFKVRSWWVRRGPRGGPGGGPGPGGPGRSAKGIRYIEAEYEVVDADAEAERGRSDDRR
jgi:hypothetical protein